MDLEVSIANVSPANLFKSDGNHDVREGEQILVNLSFEVGAGIKRTTVRTEPAP